MATTKKTTTKKTTRPKEAKVKAEPIQETLGEDVAIAEPVKESKAVNDTSAEIEALKAQIEAMKAELLSRSAAPQVITISNDTEKVTFLWQAPVADDNVVTFGINGMYGRIVGKTGSFYIPKDDLSKILDESVRNFLAKRWLIVVSGLDDNEREALGIDYKDGELLDKKAFTRMVELGDELLGIYPDLCDSHKEIVAKCLHEKYMSGNYISRELVLKLNRISPSPALREIIEDINAKELEN